MGYVFSEDKDNMAEANSDIDIGERTWHRKAQLEEGRQQLGDYQGSSRSRKENKVKGLGSGSQRLGGLTGTWWRGQQFQK